MTYKEFCSIVCPMAAEMKKLCENMSPEEFEDYKDQVRREIGEENKIGLQFMEKIFGMINPNTKAA